jgi:hypothetical protein
MAVVFHYTQQDLRRVTLHHQRAKGERIRLRHALAASLCSVKPGLNTRSFRADCDVITYTAAKTKEKRPTKPGSKYIDSVRSAARLRQEYTRLARKTEINATVTAFKDHILPRKGPQLAILELKTCQPWSDKLRHNVGQSLRAASMGV